MKIIDTVKTANGNLFRNKTRTFLTILAIFIGSFAIILNTAINTGVNEFIDKQLESLGGDGYLEITSAAMYDTMASMMGANSGISEYDEDGSKNKGMESAYLNESDIEKIKSIDGVWTAQIYNTYTVEYIKNSEKDKKFTLSGVSLIPDKAMKVDLVAGRMVDVEGSKYEVLLTEDYVKSLGFSSNEDALGKKVKIAVKQTMKCYQTTKCTKELEGEVVGVQAPGVLVNAGRMNLSPAFYNALYDATIEGIAEEAKPKSYAAIATADPTKVEEVKKALDAAGYKAMTLDDEIGMFRIFLDAIMVVFNIFGGIALLAAAIGIVNTLFMSVQERTREIGLSKALGMSNGQVFLSFSLEAILLGFWGSVVGIALSMLVGYGANTLAHMTFLSDLPTFDLVVFKPINMIVISLIIMAIGFVAGTAPARKASRQNPIDSLRYE